MYDVYAIGCMCDHLKVEGLRFKNTEVHNVGSSHYIVNHMNKNDHIATRIK
jgi:hypothetical protein